MGSLLFPLFKIIYSAASFGEIRSYCYDPLTTAVAEVTYGSSSGNKFDAQMVGEDSSFIGHGVTYEYGITGSFVTHDCLLHHMILR